MVFSSKSAGQQAGSPLSPDASLSQGSSSLSEVGLMLIQFRTRYPSASLISELLQIYEGHYVVRVSIQQEGTLLVTGLASAEVLEQAEDRARLRAIEGLGITFSGSYRVPPLLEVSPSIASLESPTSQRSVLESFSPTTLQETGSLSNPSNGPEREIKPVSLETRSPLPPVGEDDPAETIFDDDPSNGDSFNLDPVEVFVGEDPDAVPEEFRTRDPSGDSTSDAFRGADLYHDFSTGSPTAAPKPVPGSPIVPIPDNPSSGPIDMSDIIAQTDWEMKRVGWTRARGRSYLIETYGKKTRQELEDDELMEFLDFLKMQPSAGP